MPILFKVDHERKEVDATALGRVGFAEIANHLGAERHFRGLAYKELMDARGAGIILTPAETRQVVGLLRSLGQQSKLGPTAVLVSNDVAFGAVCMLEVLAEDVANIKPFRDESEARAWLASQS